MALFDFCRPDPSLDCPRCDSGALTGWQFRDGQVCLFIWQQGHAAPLGQDLGVDADFAARPEWVALHRLPYEFVLLYGRCESCGYSWRGTARGRCDEAGVWRTTELLPSPLVGRIIEDDWLQCPECCDALQFRPTKHLYTCQSCHAVLQLPTGAA